MQEWFAEMQLFLHFFGMEKRPPGISGETFSCFSISYL